MRLIEGSELLKEFEERLRDATDVDIAVAWAGPCVATELLRKVAEENGTKVRIAVGLSGNATNPSTLRNISKFAELRIGEPLSSGIFHPKFYCFYCSPRVICWVGSANLTQKGFGGNDELVHEFDDLGYGCQWFDRLWTRLDQNPTEAIDKYEKDYVPPKYSPRQHSMRPVRIESGWTQLNNTSTWADFVKGLRVRDEPRSDKGWNILGETHSYLHTISTGREVVQRGDWTTLTKREGEILSGFESKIGKKEGNWGLLGSLKGAAKARSILTNNAPENIEIRRRICQQVKRVLVASDDEVANIAADAMKVIRNEKGFGPAAATRLFALARPDRLVSINNESAALLGKFAGLPKTRESLANHYSELLDWVYDRLWYQSPQPDDSSEREIWICRAALLDVFAYTALNK